MRGNQPGRPQKVQIDEFYRKQSHVSVENSSRLWYDNATAKQAGHTAVTSSGAPRTGLSSPDPSHHKRIDPSIQKGAAYETHHLADHPGTVWDR